MSDGRDANAPRRLWEGAARSPAAPALAARTISSRLRRPRRHLGPRLVPVHVHLAPHAELPRQVDPRLDREAHARDQPPVVVGLVVVEVRTRAVQVAVDRVAGPVHEAARRTRPLRPPPAPPGRPRTRRSAALGRRRVRTAPTAASRASRTVSHTRCTCGGTRLPANPIQVWSAKTVVRLRPAQRSSRITSPDRERRVASRRAARSAGWPSWGRSPRSAACRRPGRAPPPPPRPAPGARSR